MANQIHLILRVVLFAACFKWPKLTKLYLYFECFLEVIVGCLPTEINVTRDVTYTGFMIFINFWMFYFEPISGLIASSLALVPVFVKRAVFHLEPATDLASNFASVLLWQCTCLWLTHLCLTKIGFIYIDVEILREGNTQTLDNLEEGIIILK